MLRPVIPRATRSSANFWLSLALALFRMKTERTRIDITCHSFIPHPSSLILSLVSSQKPLDVLIVRLAQRLIGAAKDYCALAHHQDFTVDQAQLLTFTLEDNLSGFVNHCVLGTKIVE